MGQFDQIPLDFETGPKFATIFSGPQLTGDELKEEGITKTQRKEKSRIYQGQLMDALKVFPVRSRITSEQLTGIVGRPPEGVSVNAIGAAINTMAKRGLIQKTGKMLKPGRKERHSNLIPEWEVMRYQ